MAKHFIPVIVTSLLLSSSIGKSMDREFEKAIKESGTTQTLTLSFITQEPSKQDGSLEATLTLKKRGIISDEQLQRNKSIVDDFVSHFFSKTSSPEKDISVAEVGTPLPSDEPTFMSIGGQGFFITNSKADTTGEFGFTRLGTFTPDKNGGYVNTRGEYLQVFPTDINGKLDVSETSFDQLITANLRNLRGEKPLASENIYLSCTLPANASTGTSYITPIPIYDSLGLEHVITFKWTYVSNDPLTWNMTASCREGEVQAPYREPGIDISFNSSGEPECLLPPFTCRGISAGVPILEWRAQSSGDLQQLTINGLTVGSDTGIRSFGTNFIPHNPHSDGFPAGEYQSTSISTDGLMSATFTNAMTLPFAQIPLAHFANPYGLSKNVETNCFTPTGNSGEATLCTAGKGRAGLIIPSAYEAGVL